MTQKQTSVTRLHAGRPPNLKTVSKKGKINLNVEQCCEK